VNKLKPLNKNMIFFMNQSVEHEKTAKHVY